MNLRDLQYLVAVADERHFGRAADACFVSQPTLSTQIRKLEAELGVELVERNPRNIDLTAAGRQVVDRARIVLAETENIRGLARRAADPDAGTLRIGLFPTLGPYLLPHVIPKVREQFPKLELLLVEDRTEQVLDDLRGGRLDVAVLALPVHDDQLVEHFLFSEDFVLAIPADHPLAGIEGLADTSVLADQSVLLLTDGHCLRDQALSVCQMVGASERAGFRATSLETLRQMVAAGVGLTLLPELAVQPPVPTQDGIRLVRFADPVPRRDIAMFWRRTSPYAAFLPRLAEIFADVPPELLGRDRTARSAGVPDAKSDAT